MNHH